MIKQVIVMRTDLNMRKGKMVAQGAHASIAWLSHKLRKYLEDIYDSQRYEITPRFPNITKEEEEWISGPFTKICVGVESEAALLEIHERAEEAGLTVHIIRDSGKTEFDGVPTFTCLAIGPHEAEKIDAITGHLKLL